MGGAMICSRCGGIMAQQQLYLDGDACISWTCYRCGEVIDPVILKNREARRLRSHSGEEESHEEIMAAIRKLPSLEALREVGLA
jgi:hypothetical protein